MLLSPLKNMGTLPWSSAVSVGLVSPSSQHFKQTENSTREVYKGNDVMGRRDRSLMQKNSK